MRPSAAASNMLNAGIWPTRETVEFRSSAITGKNGPSAIAFSIVTNVASVSTGTLQIFLPDRPPSFPAFAATVNSRPRFLSPGKRAHLATRFSTRMLPGPTGPVILNIS